MLCLVGIDDTDSSRGLCTTYLAYRIALDLRPEVEVLPYPRLVRLNPNVPFKTRGNAAVSLLIATPDPTAAFERISSKVTELSDVEGGANTGLVFATNPNLASRFEPLYFDALSGLVSPHRVRRLLRENGVKSLELGNGMGVVGAASSLGFDTRFDHTYELIAYRQKELWGTRRLVDGSAVRKMDAGTFPHTFNNYDYQKKKALVAPHGPDPVFMGIRGDSPHSVLDAFSMVPQVEPLQGHMVYVSNQHTDAHLQRQLAWKVYSSGWCEGTASGVEVGVGGHVYVSVDIAGEKRVAAAYEPTADLKRTARLLQAGDRVRMFGGVRRATSLHPKVLNLEKFELLAAASRNGPLHEGVYISSPRANRHLTKPLIRYGRENHTAAGVVQGWLDPVPIWPQARARSR